jgi:hypothetical protein
VKFCQTHGDLLRAVCKSSRFSSPDPGARPNISSMTAIAIF